MKRLFSLLVAVMVVLCSVSVPAFAEYTGALPPGVTRVGNYLHIGLIETSTLTEIQKEFMRSWFAFADIPKGTKKVFSYFHYVTDTSFQLVFVTFQSGLFRRVGTTPIPGQPSIDRYVGSNQNVTDVMIFDYNKSTKSYQFQSFLTNSNYEMSPYAVISGSCVQGFVLSDRQIPSSKYVYDNDGNLGNESKKHSLTVYYQYEDGTKAADSHNGFSYEGVIYSVPSPDVPGALPNKTSITGTMGTSDVVQTVIYRKLKYKLQINYQYEDGTEAAPPYTASLEKDMPYSVASPEIPDYVPDQTTVSGVMGTADFSHTVTYRKIPKYPLLISYNYEDGTEAAPPYTASLEKDTPYSVASPEIPDYVPDQTTVSGVMPDAAVSASVVYKVPVPPALGSEASVTSAMLLPLVQTISSNMGVVLFAGLALLLLFISVRVLIGLLSRYFKP